MFKRNKNIIIVTALILCSPFFIGCTKQTEESIKISQQIDQYNIEEADKRPKAEVVKLEEQEIATKTDKSVAGWRQVSFIDSLTGKEFKINNFKDKPVFLESFAVWCPTCLRQQKEMKKLKDKIGDNIVHISLDTDPNEDNQIVKNHAVKNGFDWFFAVSNAQTTKSLIDEFGIKFVNAPGAPVVLLCPNGNNKFLDNGLKLVDELKQSIDIEC